MSRRGSPAYLFARDEAKKSDPHRTRERPSPQSPSLKPGLSESSTQLRIDVSKLWSESDSAAYTETRKKIAAQWSSATGESRKRFLERAVELLADHQSRPMASPKDTLDWLKYLDTSGIDPERYLDWAQEQYKLLAAEKRKFYNISIKRFSECLSRAHWLDGNDESAIVNAYLLDADRYVMPQIYLGPFEDSHLALRLNGTCLRPPNADLATIESYGVTDVNVNILLGIRFLVSNSDNLQRDLLFIPLGE